MNQTHSKKKIIRSVTVAQSVGFFVHIVDDLREHGYDVVTVSSPGPELQALRDKGVKVIEVKMERHISLAKDTKALLVLINVFAKEKPFIVHSMTPKAGMLCMVAAWVTRVPRRVHTFTGLVWPTSTGLRRKILMFTDWLTCVCATHIIPEGTGVMNDLQVYITKKTMKVLGYGNVKGVDLFRFSLRPEVKARADKIKQNNVFTFVFVGRLVGDKGINELVEAFIWLLQKKYKARLFLVGQYEENLDPLNQKTLEIINHTSEIQAVGTKYGDDLLAYFSASDCFVFPSYREGFPNTVMEAGAMGLPCIVTDINGSREIIVDGENGVIIPSKDVDALCNAMEDMLVDVYKTKQMAANARPMIESRFEQDFVRKCLYDFYDEIG